MAAISILHLHSDNPPAAGPIIKGELISKVFDWLTNHIQKVDMAYSACLIQHGAH